MAAEPAPERGLQPPDPEADAVRDAYLEALLQADVNRARGVVRAALDAGMTRRALYLFVFQPTLYEIGRRWQEGEVTVAQEHLATATTQTLITRLEADPQTTPRHELQAITTATENELHALGTRFLADFLESEGWSVIDLGANTPTADLVHVVGQVQPVLVCLSTSFSENLPQAQEAIEALRRLPRAPLIAVGGHAYAHDERLAARLGADLHARDADAFLHALRARLSRRAST